MFDWWNVLGSLVRVHAWAQALTVLFLVLTASSALLTWKTGSRIADLKTRSAPQAAPAPSPQEPAPVPQTVPVPLTVPAAPVPQPVPAAPVAKPVPAAPVAPPAAAAPRPEAPQRHLEGQTRVKLLALLKQRPKGKVEITFMKGDGESQVFAGEIAELVGSAGWQTTRLGPMAEFPGSSGLHFMIKSIDAEPENTKFLIHSFIEAGLKPSTELNKTLREDTLLLVVGHR